MNQQLYSLADSATAECQTFRPLPLLLAKPYGIKTSAANYHLTNF